MARRKKMTALDKVMAKVRAGMKLNKTDKLILSASTDASRQSKRRRR